VLRALEPRMVLDVVVRFGSWFREEMLARWQSPKAVPRVRQAGRNSLIGRRRSGRFSGWQSAPFGHTVDISHFHEVAADGAHIVQIQPQFLGKLRLDARGVVDHGGDVAIVVDGRQRGLAEVPRAALADIREAATTAMSRAVWNSGRRLKVLEG